MATAYFLTIAALTASAVCGKIYFKEDFQSESWKSRWVVPTGWKSEVKKILKYL